MGIFHYVLFKALPGLFTWRDLPLATSNQHSESMFFIFCANISSIYFMVASLSFTQKLPALRGRAQLCEAGFGVAHLGTRATQASTGPVVSNGVFRNLKMSWPIYSVTNIVYTYIYISIMALIHTNTVVVTLSCKEFKLSSKVQCIQNHAKKTN